MNNHRHLRWLHRDKLSTVIGLCTLLLIVVLGVALVQRFTQPQATLRLGDGIFTAHVATTESARQKGLGDTELLADNEAMILAFERDARWSIWMKDVEYPIDVVWLDARHKVVHIVKNMPPSSYPDTSFMPDKPARYVVEFAAGTVEKKAIRIGAIAHFDIADIQRGDQ
jgi:uncharacterized membrane protein (UPF0127 family)